MIALPYTFIIYKYCIYFTIDARAQKMHWTNISAMSFFLCKCISRKVLQQNFCRNTFLAILLQSQVLPERCCRNNVLRQNFCGNIFLAILPQSHLHTKNDTAATLPQCIARMLLQYCCNNARMCCQKVNILVRVSFITIWEEK